MILIGVVVINAEGGIEERKSDQKSFKFINFSILLNMCMGHYKKNHF